MTATVITKPNMQRILKQLRATKFADVQKVSNGYVVTANCDGKSIKTGDVMLKAMIGNNNYLVRSLPGLLDAVTA